MAYMISWVMFGNGVRIGIVRTIIVVLQLRIHQGRAQAHSGYCGVVIGTMVQLPCGWLIASTSLRLIGTTPSGFDVCQDRILPLASPKKGALQAAKKNKDQKK